MWSTVTKETASSEMDAILLPQFSAMLRCRNHEFKARSAAKLAYKEKGTYIPGLQSDKIEVF